MIVKQSNNNFSSPLQDGISKRRPAHYGASNPHNLAVQQNRNAYIVKYWWRPDSGGTGLPRDPVSQQARVDKFFAAMMDFGNVSDSDNNFTDGRVIDNDDVEFACMRIADAIDTLHDHGVCLPFIADPTAYEVWSKGQKIWKARVEERNLTATEREDAVADHLRQYKKACLDAIHQEKDLIILFVAAPYSASRTRIANAKSNHQRKRKAQLQGEKDIPSPKRKMSVAATSIRGCVSQGSITTAAGHLSGGMASANSPNVQSKLQNVLGDDLNLDLTSSITDPFELVFPPTHSFMAPGMPTDGVEYDWISDNKGILPQIWPTNQP